MQNARIDGGRKMLLIVRGLVEAPADLAAKIGIQYSGGRRPVTARQAPPQRSRWGTGNHGRVRKIGSPILPA